MNDIVAILINGQEISLQEVLCQAKCSRDWQFLENVIVTNLILQAAAENNLSVSDQELQESADQFREENELFKTGDTEAWLAHHHMNLDDFERFIEQTILTKKLKSHITKDKIDPYLSENLSSFDQAKISHILVEKEKLAEELFLKISEEDADFSLLAERYSLDKKSCSNGGKLGFVFRNSLSPALETATFGAQIGSFLGPIKTNEGYHIVWVESIKYGAVNEQNRHQAQEILFAQWLKEYRQKNNVKIPLLEKL